jgi:hypothetical protein
MAAHALAEKVGDQLGLYEGWAPPRRVLPPRPTTKLCAGCRAKEARYGFRDDAEEAAARDERPRTLCFECFRMEIDRRQRVMAQLARGWNAEQSTLPLADTLQELTRRRRRAQIAARHAVGA